MFRVRTFAVCVPIFALVGCPDDEGPLSDPFAPVDAALAGSDASYPPRDSGSAPDDDTLDQDAGGASADAGIDDDTDAELDDAGSDPDAPRDAGEHEDLHDAGDLDDAGALEDAGVPFDAGSSPDAGSEIVDAGAIVDAGPDASSLDAGKPYTGIPDAGVKLPVTVQFDPLPVLDSSFTAVYAILQSRCRSCHGSSFNYSLDLSTRQIAHEELVSGPNLGAAEFISCEKTGSFRVIPADPGNSLIIQKLFNVQHCGDRMPTNGVLSLSERSVIWTWIAQGAAND